MPTYPIVHLEISAKDPAAASKFYADLAGWKIEVDPNFNYYQFTAEGGPGGGFVLNRKPGEVSIKDILDAVGEPTFPAPCTDPGDPDRCSRKTGCRVTKTWQRFADVINGFLSGLTLKDVLEDSGGKLAAGLKPGQDFAI